MNPLFCYSTRMFVLFYVNYNFCHIAKSMKHKLLLLVTLLLSTVAYSQNKYWAKLPVYGGVQSISVSPKEHVWIATRAGNTYYTTGIQELWHVGPFGSQDEYAVNEGTFERVSFFSEDTLMISGYIQGEASNTDFIYWSGDGGANWKQVKFGHGSWIDAVHVGPKGQAWMSGSSQYIYYTKDYGQTWEQKPKVEATGNLRFNTIHFSKDAKTGLFGSHWNVIYKTEDNCKSWKKLPTPLSQEKYKRLSKNDRPDIRKIRIFENYIVVNQQGRTFYTAGDNIDWQPLPGVTDFEITRNGAIYLVKDDLTIELLNDNLETTWKSEAKLAQQPTAIETYGNSLYAYSHGHLYKISKDTFEHSIPMTAEVSISEPYQIVNFGGEKIGFAGDEILRFDKSKKQWYRLIQLPFATGNATKFQNELLFSDAALQDYYTVDLANSSYKRFELPKELFNLNKKTIKSFTVEKGSQGCFHNDNQSVVYKLKGENYVAAARSKNQSLTGMPAQVPATAIKDIVAEVNDSRFKQVTLADLKLTEKDMKAYTALIDEQERKLRKNGSDWTASDNPYSFPGENADFNFYRSVANSMHTIPDSVVNKVFGRSYGSWSTTSDWVKFTFTFNDGSALTVSNTDDKPNYLYAPWVIDYNGLVFKSNSLALGEYLNELTNGKLLEATPKQKKYALYQIADYLYRSSLR